MKALFHLAAAAAAGTLVMFYLDPVSGPRRRARLRTTPFSRHGGRASVHGHATELGVDGELAGPGGGIGTAP
ncbi:hypothetical protein LMG27952_01331 [Paraburkholderia hiiakae]|uniref:Uncharacterized protein n=1 Tax=Paraburkholderia hiiakae TaxID=1081782 RepID=A0ABN7HK48_9BURK|nr:hypothetical protein [Paraburkholderia hiiakae]CAD6520569.1 hypothetical protein LMG27952_01331 [Paraburkholderia hiiakae]